LYFNITRASVVLVKPTRVTRAQARVLVSPLRQEILDVLARMGDVSLARLAEVLGRPADGLYYHVRLLERAGLVRSAGERRTGGRREALFRAVAPQFALQYGAGADRDITAIVGSMLRLGARDFRRALAAGGNRVAGPSRDLWALRTTGWLGPVDLKVVNQRIASLSAATTRASGERLYAVTVLLTPLDHRARQPRGRSGSRRRAAKASR
jgi:DNA-binding transcriptional ArsR family regulator